MLFAVLVQAPILGIYGNQLLVGGLLRRARHDMMGELVGSEEVAHVVRIVYDVMKGKYVAGSMKGRGSHEAGSRANVMVILLVPWMECVHRRPALQEEEVTAIAYTQEPYYRERAEIRHLQQCV